MRIQVRVTPGARRERVEKEGERYLIAVREPAERGEANDRIRAILAREFGVPISRVRFRTGMRSPNKTFELES